jgi:hypothetical protein
MTDELEAKSISGAAARCLVSPSAAGVTLCVLPGWQMLISDEPLVCITEIRSKPLPHLSVYLRPYLQKVLGTCGSLLLYG